MTYAEMLERLTTSNANELAAREKYVDGSRYYTLFDDRQAGLLSTSAIHRFRVVERPNLLNRIFRRLGLVGTCLWCRRAIEYPAVAVEGNIRDGNGGWNRLTRLVCIDLASCEEHRRARRAAETARLDSMSERINV